MAATILFQLSRHLPSHVNVCISRENAGTALLRLLRFRGYSMLWARFTRKGVSMERLLRKRISDIRRLMGNPYAFLDDEGNFSAVPDVRLPGVPADEVAADRLRLQNQYAHLDGNGGFSVALGQVTAPFPRVAADLTGRYDSLRNKRKGRRYLYSEIEAKAIEMQRLIWLHRNEIGRMVFRLTPSICSMRVLHSN